MDRQLPAWASIALMAAISAILLVSTHLITGIFRLPEGTLGKDSAQGEALPAAEQFLPLALADGSGLDNAYEGQVGGKTVGYTGQVTVKGYAGPIEVVVGMDLNGLLTGISVGGDQFKESPGLGAKAKDPEFKSQFVGIAAPVGLNKGDATSSATESGEWASAAAPSVDAASSATQTGDWSATAAPTAGAAQNPAQAEPPALEASSDAINGGNAAAMPTADAVNGATQTTPVPTMDDTSGAAQSDAFMTTPVPSVTPNATPGGDLALKPTATTASTIPAADATSGATESIGNSEAESPLFQTLSSGMQTMNPGSTATPAADTVSGATESGDWAQTAPAVEAATGGTQSGDWAATAKPSGDAVSGATQNSNVSIPETPTDEAASTVDAISGATITSAAIVNGINQCMAYLKTLLSGGNG